MFNFVHPCIISGVIYLILIAALTTQCQIIGHKLEILLKEVIVAEFKKLSRYLL
jgi:hypothetical protein